MAWSTLAGLAVQTSHVKLGTLMTAATFRHPGPLAITVATVDAMSGGRVELGLGAGWYEREHQSLGIPFPSTSERFDRLEEQLAILSGLGPLLPTSILAIAASITIWINAPTSPSTRPPARTGSPRGRVRWIPPPPAPSPGHRRRGGPQADSVPRGPLRR